MEILSKPTIPKFHFTPTPSCMKWPNVPPFYLRDTDLDPIGWAFEASAKKK